MYSPPEEARPDFVFVAGKVYPAAVLHDAIADALLARLRQSLPENSSLRRAARSIQSLRTPEAHRAVMNRALEIVEASGKDIPLEEAVKLARGLPIAAFPNRIDSRAAVR